MEPENLRFGGGFTSSLLHPVVAVIVLITVIIILLLPRRFVIGPLLFATFLIPIYQQIVLGGFHFTVVRLLIAAGCARMAFTKLTTRTELLAGGVNALDKAFTLWAIYRASALVLLFMEMGAVINSCGFLLDSLGGYFFLRFLIRDREDVYRTVGAITVVASILAACLFNEKVRVQNVFGFLGTPWVPGIREGAVRAQGSFANPILTGVFGATLAPMFLIAWKGGRSKVAMILGLISSVIITLASWSSTALMGYMGGLLAICFWPLRKKMRLVRWGIVVGLILLQLVMKVPVWWIISHINIIGGSSSYHRAFLVDQFIRHFSSWWLIGVRETSSWGWDMWDIANQFAAEGVSGGLVAFASFILMISICFRWIGKARAAVEGDREMEWMYWCLGAALFSHIVSFFGISYFDQTRMSWFVLLAIIPAIAVPVLRNNVVSTAQVSTSTRNPKLSYAVPSVLSRGTTR